MPDFCYVYNSYDDPFPDYDTEPALIYANP
jgi:hypothetical protein